MLNNILLFSDLPSNRSSSVANLITLVIVLKRTITLVPIAAALVLFIKVIIPPPVVNAPHMAVISFQIKSSSSIMVIATITATSRAKLPTTLELSCAAARATPGTRNISRT